MKNLVFTIAIGVCLIGCKAKKDVQSAAAVEKVELSAEMLQGKKLFDANCGLCNSQNYAFGQHHDKLRTVVPKMVSMANEKLGKTAIDENGGSLLLEYLISINTL